MALTYLNFGGFRRTHHGERVESWVNPDWTDYKYIYDWDKAQVLYGRYYVQWFNSLFDTNLEFVSIWKPETFDMQVEAIAVRVSEQDADLLQHVVYTEFGDDYFRILNQGLRFRSGYLVEPAEFSYDEPVDRKLECVLYCLIEKLESDWDTYYFDVVVPQVPDEGVFRLEDKVEWL